MPPPPDLCVLVRPPPSLGSHPLNLQVQLLVPTNTSRAGGRPASLASTATAGTSGARSLDAVAGASVSRDGLVAGEEMALSNGGEHEGAETTLSRSRSPSVSSMHSSRSTRSNRSATSAASYADSEGAGSVGGGGGTGGRRRKVTPLLNLEYHSVLPTVVTDAGTDARVARFHKRGVELTGLGVFDPIELSSLYPSPFPSTSTSPPGTTTHVRTASNASTATATASHPLQASPLAQGGFLTRFKKLGFSSPSAPSAAGSALSPFPSASSASSSPDAPLPGSLPLIRTPSSPSTSPSRDPSSAPREEGYAFIPRRWTREDLSSSSSSGVGGAPRGIEGGWRIEWARPGRRGSKASTGSGGRRARAGTVTSTEELRAEVEGRGEAGAQEEEEDEEIDAEDDDRPWVCTLVYPLSSPSNPLATLSPPTAASPRVSTSSSRGPSTSTSRSSSPSPPPSSSTAVPAPAPAAPTLRKLNLATLRPHPHHPTLISTLLLPPSLPSLPLGTFSPSHGSLSLSPEELRDLAMVTATWVAVREGLGGLGGGDMVREEAGRSSLGVKLGRGGG
ncbi:hypothetical protein JCM11251_007598, partial [Rhodosporidiobolus azoricus]